MLEGSVRFTTLYVEYLQALDFYRRTQEAHADATRIERLAREDAEALFEELTKAGDSLITEMMGTGPIHI